jgi:GNAT superfamily N-acetyltransferase
MSKAINRIITGQYPVVGMRRAKLIDVPVLDALIKQSLKAAAEGHYTPRQIESALESIAFVDNHLIEEGTLYAVTSGGEIVGVGGWSSRGTRYKGDFVPAKSEKIDPTSTPAYLRSLYVKPHWTRMGVASRLVEDCITAARQAGFQQMEMLSTPMSHAFFIAQGFEAKEQTEITLPDNVKLPFTHMVKPIASHEQGHDRLSDSEELD